MTFLLAAESSLSERLATLLILVVLFFSFTFWVSVVLRLRIGGPLRIGVPRTPVPWTGLGVFVSFFVAFLVPEFVILATTSFPPESPRTLSVLDAQRSCAANLTQAWVLLLLLHFHSPLRATDLGWRRLAHWTQVPSGESEMQDPQTVSTFTLNDLTIGFLGFIACILPVFLINLGVEQARSLIMSWMGLEGERPRHPLLTILKNDPQWSTVVWIALSVVVIAPLAEELLYRVVLQGYLEKRHPLSAVVVSSLVFAGVHSLGGRPDALPLFPLALILGFVYRQRHSFPAVVLLHALFNGLNLLLALGSPE